MSPRRRPRGVLTEEDLRLWTEVARTAKPLRGKTVPQPASDAIAPIEPERKAPRVAKRPLAPGAASGTGPQPRSDLTTTVALEQLERRLMRRLRRGTVAPGANIDLHGLRQEEAMMRLQGFLRRCQAEGAKTAVVITGKGGRGAAGGEPGVLRRAVPLWLAMPDLRPLVVGFEEAGAGLGGSGALIVRIRAAARRGSSGGA